ncbi:MAG: ribosome biogenesis GTP-binding protein YsxC [Clostridia bacterium]|nr:ribosome biogenesis GTP-binding protein YsxC [Clostridia bacterium]
MKKLFDVKRLVTAGTPAQFPRDGKPHAVLLGRSNVGKSSLVNALTGSSAARVSKKPGKTVTINFYDTGDFYLADLPGYGYARRSAGQTKDFSSLTDTYMVRSKDRRIFIQLIDLLVGPTADDMMMLDWLVSNGESFFVAATKSDKPNAGERRASLEKMAGEPLLSGIKIVPTSVKTGEGTEEICKTVSAMLKSR